MTTPYQAQHALAAGLGTTGIQQWLLSNAIPLLLLVVALLLVWLGGGKGDNSAVMKRVAGILLALAVVGLAVSGGGVALGKWLSNLFTG